jgi:hypothetical protein
VSWARGGSKTSPVRETEVKGGASASADDPSEQNEENRRTLGMLHEHVRSGDSDEGELDEAVVDTVSTHLLSDVSDVDPGQEHERSDPSRRAPSDS